MWYASELLFETVQQSSWLYLICNLDTANFIMDINALSPIYITSTSKSNKQQTYQVCPQIWHKVNKMTPAMSTDSVSL